MLGAVLGTGYDYIHVLSGVLSYSNPDFYGTSLWVPPQFGLAGLLGGACVLALSRTQPTPRVALARCFTSGTLLLVAYLATAFLDGSHTEVLAGLLLTLAMGVQIFRRERLSFLVAIIGMVLGPSAEASLITLGFFRYNHAGLIPIWLPFLWMIASGLFLDLGLALLRPRDGLGN